MEEQGSDQVCGTLGATLFMTPLYSACSGAGPHGVQDGREISMVFRGASTRRVTFRLCERTGRKHLLVLGHSSCQAGAEGWWLTPDRPQGRLWALRPGLSASRKWPCWHSGWGRGGSPAYTHSGLTPAGAVLAWAGGGSGDPAAGKWSPLDQPRPEATQDQLRGCCKTRMESCCRLRQGYR